MNDCNETLDSRMGAVGNVGAEGGTSIEEPAPGLIVLTGVDAVIPIDGEINCWIVDIGIDDAFCCIFFSCDIVEDIELLEVFVIFVISFLLLVMLFDILLLVFVLVFALMVLLLLISMFVLLFIELLFNAFITIF